MYANKAPPAPEGAPLQQTATWPGPPKDPPAEVEEMEVADVDPPWNARERTVIVQMERFLENSVKIQVGITELEHLLLDPEEEACSMFPSEYARDG